MDTLLNRYRNVTVLLLVICAQLILLAYQVKNDRDVRLIRMWAVTAVTPVARAVEGVRGGVSNFTGNYLYLRDTREDNRRLQSELGRLKLENQHLQNELSTADRTRALATLQEHAPSKMIAARVIGTATGGTSKAVFVDRGSGAGVEKGMAVITPDGIVGKVQAAYPTASLVLLVTDSAFAAGVVSQKNRVRGVLKGSGYGTCRVDYVQPEEKVEIGEWFYTSGDDRIFPKGMPAGKVTAARSGGTFQDITVAPSGTEKGLEEVLIVLEVVHQAIPDFQAANSETPMYVAPAPPAAEGDGQPATTPATGNPKPTLGTEADRLREHYKELGDAQKHTFGEGVPGSKPPDFNMKIERPPADAAGAPPAQGPATAPATVGKTPEAPIPLPGNTAPIKAGPAKPPLKKPDGPAPAYTGPAPGARP